MSYKFTATTVSSTVERASYTTSAIAGDISIQNMGTNPVYIDVGGALATTSTTVLPSQYSSWQFKDMGVSRISFITTGGSSDVVIQAV